MSASDAIQEITQNANFFVTKNQPPGRTSAAVRNVFMGPDVNGVSPGQFVTTAADCVGIGAGALDSAIVTQQSTCVGSRAGSDLTGNFNTLVGANSGAQLTVGEGNSFFGSSSGGALTNCNQVTIVGQNTMPRGNNISATTVIGQGSCGVTAACNNVSGLTAVGTTAAANLTSGTGTFIGQNAGYSITTGDGTFLGRDAGYAVTTASANVIVGAGAGFDLTSPNNTIIGSAAGQNITVDATAAGSNVVIGGQCGTGLITGYANTLIGTQAASALTGSGNVVLAGLAGCTGAVAGNDNVLIGASGCVTGPVVGNSSIVISSTPATGTNASNQIVMTTGGALSALTIGSTAAAPTNAQVAIAAGGTCATVSIATAPSGTVDIGSGFSSATMDINICDSAVVRTAGTITLCSHGIGAVQTPPGLIIGPYIMPTNQPAAGNSLKIVGHDGTYWTTEWA
jgi:hypothetical protein